MPTPSSVAILGLGEVGGILAADLGVLGVERIAAYDPLFVRPGSRPSQAAAQLGVQTCASAPEAVRGAELVISAVTAAQALAAAEAAAAGIEQGAYFLDLNSASPSVKQAAGRAIEAAGGRYVEAAVMASYPPKRLKTPMLLGGAHAAAFLADVEPWGLDARVFAEEVGKASATKMCRSVLVKGMEALLCESMLAARKHGVEEVVLDSLSDMLPHPEWRRQARYMISRALIHGKRRAEEMREVARTVQEAGVEPLMSAATAERQDWAWRFAEKLEPGMVDEPDLGLLLDALRRVIEAEGVMAAE